MQKEELSLIILNYTLHFLLGEGGGARYTGIRYIAAIYCILCFIPFEFELEILTDFFK